MLPDRVDCISTDGMLTANSDTILPTQRAVKTYYDTASGGWTRTAGIKTVLSDSNENVGVQGR